MPRLPTQQLQYILRSSLKKEIRRDTREAIRNFEKRVGWFEKLSVVSLEVYFRSPKTPNLFRSMTMPVVAQ